MHITSFRNHYKKNDNFNAGSDIEYIPSKKNVAPTSTQKASTRSKILKPSSEYLKSNSQALLTDIPRQIVATQSRKEKK